MTDTATYLYALVRPLPESELAGLRGVGDAPVRTIDAGELACLVSTVDLNEFGEEALRANLEDLAWLERAARQHDDVVRAAAQITTTVPLRLATICASDAAARERLDQLGDGAVAALADLEGREEWGVKLFASVEDLIAPAPPATESSGAAYLRRRKQQLTERTDAVERAAQSADRLFRQLAEHAVEARRHRPQDQRLTGVSTPMVLNAAFLVDRERADEFRAAVDELAAERPPDSLVLTGPWPPYSFAMVEEG